MRSLFALFVFGVAVPAFAAPDATAQLDALVAPPSPPIVPAPRCW